MYRLQRTIHQWADWKLLSFGGHDYELHHLCDGRWLRFRSIRAHDEIDAIQLARDLIADANRKMAS